jgi:hypothetical protein
MMALTAMDAEQAVLSHAAPIPLQIWKDSLFILYPKIAATVKV